MCKFKSGEKVIVTDYLDGSKFIGIIVSWSGNMPVYTVCSSDFRRNHWQVFEHEIDSTKDFKELDWIIWGIPLDKEQ